MPYSEVVPELPQKVIERMERFPNIVMVGIDDFDAFIVSCEQTLPGIMGREGVISRELILTEIVDAIHFYDQAYVGLQSVIPSIFSDDHGLSLEDDNIFGVVSTLIFLGLQISKELRHLGVYLNNQLPYRFNAECRSTLSLVRFDKDDVQI